MYTNVASIEGCLKSHEKEYPCGHGYGKTPGTSCKVKESNTVEVEVELETPSFSIKKEQRIKGEGAYTAAKLKGQIGETVEYLITVEDTGTSAITFGSLSDAKCTNIQPTGSFELTGGMKKTFTCEHVLVEADAPIYTNVASIEGCLKSHEKEFPCGHGYGKTPGTTCKVKESNTVEVEVEPEEKHFGRFTIVKEQRIQGELLYTRAKLGAEVGKKVEYKITVENTGSTTLKFGSLKDLKCTGISPSGETTLKPGESETFSCEHVLTETDESPYKNTASITGGTETLLSNTVEVEIQKPSFSIHKEQRIAGEVGYTAAKLVSEVGKKVEYKIVVTNTGNTTLKFGALKDTKCSGISAGWGNVVETDGIGVVYV